MYEPFANYVWNLSVNIALNTGGHFAEIDSACRQVVTTSGSEEDSGTESFFAAWCELADRLVELAAEDRFRGHELSAAQKYLRAAVYYQTAERMQSRHYGPRLLAYQRMLTTFAAGTTLARVNCTRVEIPYEGASLPALFVAAATPTATDAAPCMVFCNGLDSTKEMAYGSGMAQELARRGISTLIVDQPGTGEALRMRNMAGYAESERWAGACMDGLRARPDVDRDRVGIMGWSLGGYYAPRAAAFDKRFAVCVAWGANYNWGELQKRRLAREGDRPVPHYWDHVQWAFGKSSLDEFMSFAPQMSLVGVAELITVPFLITHGVRDRQIPASDATAQYEAAVNSPERELKWFTEREGGVEHVSADNMLNASAYIADWVAANL